MLKIDEEELFNYLDFLLDKVELCYEEEIRKSIERFKKDLLLKNRKKENE